MRTTSQDREGYLPLKPGQPLHCRSTMLQLSFLEAFRFPRRPHTSPLNSSSTNISNMSFSNANNSYSYSNCNNNPHNSISHQAV